MAGDDRAWRRYHVLIALLLLAVVVLDGVIILHRMMGPGTIELDLTEPRRFGLQLDPDLACAEALAKLPGMNIGRARAIVQFREVNRDPQEKGRFYRTLDDVDQVPGIGPKTLEKVADYLHFPPLDSNKAEKTR